MTDKQKQIIGGFLALALLGGLLYYLFGMKKEPRTRVDFSQGNTTRASSAVSAQPQVVYVNNATASPSGTTLYVKRYSQSSEVSRLQQHLKTEFRENIDVDGFFGPQTIGAIGRHFTKIGEAAQRNQGLTKQEFDVIMRSFRKSASTPAATGSRRNGSSEAEASQGGPKQRAWWEIF